MVISPENKPNKVDQDMLKTDQPKHQGEVILEYRDLKGNDKNTIIHAWRSYQRKMLSSSRSLT